jgi:hypothetical protein
MLVVVVVVGTLPEVHIQRQLVALVVVEMGALLPATQPVVMQRLTLVEVVVLETILTVTQKAEKAALAS